MDLNAQTQRLLLNLNPGAQRPRLNLATQRPLPNLAARRPRVPAPPQWNHGQSYTWIQEPVLHIYIPGASNAAIKISPHLASSHGRADKWILLEDMQFPALQAKTMEAAAALTPRLTEYEQLKLTWCPRFPHATAGYPELQLEDEVEVTQSNFLEIILAAEQQFCGGCLPRPPNGLEEIAVSFIVRWRPEMIHTSVPAPIPASPPPPPPPVRVQRKSSLYRSLSSICLLLTQSIAESVYFNEGRSRLRNQWVMPENDNRASNDANNDANNRADSNGLDNGLDNGLNNAINNCFGNGARIGVKN